MLSTCIGKVTSSNLSWDSDLLWFPAAFQANAQMVPCEGYDCFLPDPIHFKIHQSSYHY